MNEKKMGIGLQRRLAGIRDYERVDVNIFMAGEHSRAIANEMAAAVDSFESVNDTADFKSAVVDGLKERTLSEQRDLIGMLHAARESVTFVDDGFEVLASSAPIESFWINNALGTTVSRQMLQEILQRDDVTFVEVERHVDVESLLDAGKKVSRSGKKSRGSKKSKRLKVTKRTATNRSTHKRSASAAWRAETAAESAIREVADSCKRTVAGGMVIGLSDDAIPNSWSVERINAPKLWDFGINGKGVLVAVIDTGINYNHPDLKKRMWDGGTAFPHHGFDFANDDDDPDDQQGHGTACAGQVAGEGMLGLRTGVAPGATIMAIRVGGVERNFWNGMQFAIDRGADVISMSMSWKYPNSPNYPGWRRACESILVAGLLHANSIGNQGDDTTTYPLPYNIATPGNCPPPRLHPLQPVQGGLSSPISCGATDDLDQLAGYSGRGPAAWELSPFVDYPYQNGVRKGLIKPDICAPGPGTLSCNWRYDPSSNNSDPYRSFGGTSAATPHIGGCLALLAQACKNSGKPILPARIQEALENTAIRVAGQTVDKENHFGAGRVDIYAAYKYGHSKGWW